MRIEARGTYFCCGLDEVQCEPLKSQFRNTKEGKIDLFESLLERLEPECSNLAIIVVQDQMSEQQFVDFLLSGLTEIGVAGLVITDISRNKKKVHKYLSSIIKPVKLGVNKATSNTIYVWTISINDLKAKSKQYGKTVKAKKPTTRKKTKAY